MTNTRYSHMRREWSMGITLGHIMRSGNQEC